MRKQVHGMTMQKIAPWILAAGILPVSAGALG